MFLKHISLLQLPGRFESIVNDNRLHELVIPNHQVVRLADGEAAALGQDVVVSYRAHVGTEKNHLFRS